MSSSRRASIGVPTSTKWARLLWSSDVVACSARGSRSRRSRGLGSLQVFALLGTVAIGCALERVDRTYEGRLEEGDRRHDADGSFYDEYRFDAEKGWRIRVEMSSTELDPFLQLRRVGTSDADFLRQNDDAEDGSTTARISVRAPTRGTYVVWANSFQSGQTGAYVLRVEAKPEPR